MIVNDLKNYVLCSQCRKFAFGSGPYQCKRGHMICPQCQPVTDVCPQCFIFVDVNDPIKCHSAVDFLMDKVPVPCVYKNYGCVEKKERGSIRDHVLTCPFGKPVSNGTEKVNVGTTVGGAGSRGGANDAAIVVVADNNVQHEETNGGGAGGRGSDDDTEIIVLEDINDHNGETVGTAGARGHASAKNSGKAKKAGVKSKDIRDEHNYVLIVLSDDDEDQKEEHAGRAADIGNKVKPQEAGNIDGGDVAKVGGHVPANALDGINEAREEQSQEADGVGRRNDYMPSVAEDEVDVGIEEEVESDRDYSKEEEDNDDNDWMEENDVWTDLDKFGSGSFSPLGQRKGTRKRREAQRYSPPLIKASASKKAKLEETRPTVLHTHGTRLRTKQSKKQLEDVAETVVAMVAVVDPLKCTFCGQKNGERLHLIKHLASFHAEPLTEKITENGREVYAVFRCCMFCDSRYIQKEDLRHHISDMHKDKV